MCVFQRKSCERVPQVRHRVHALGPADELVEMVHVVPRRAQHRDASRSTSRPRRRASRRRRPRAPVASARRRAAACRDRVRRTAHETKRTSTAFSAGARYEADERRVLVEDRQHAVGVAARQAQHDLGDADRLVVLELARVGHGAERHDLQRRRIAADGFARAVRGRAARRARRRRRSGSSRRRTRRCARTASVRARRR